MNAVDDAFDEESEAATADFNAPSVPGIYDVCVRATDQSGNVGDPECAMLVVYDPTGGFVSGGGWIDSPAGAYSANPSLTGKAQFAFVSKYAKGATAPSGNTGFRFKAGDLDFQSTNYEWLLVSQGGKNAQFKGSGTVNREGDYRFMLWATDDDPDDTFRIKIWEEIGGVEVTAYDNGGRQPIGGGSILIHTGK